MPIKTLFKRAPDNDTAEQADQLVADLKSYLKIGQKGVRHRHSDLLRIDVNPKIYAALAHVGYTRNAFVSDRVLVVDDIFVHVRIVDDLAVPQGFRFVFCNTRPLTPPRSTKSMTGKRGSRPGAWPRPQPA